MDEHTIDNREALSSNLRPWTMHPWSIGSGTAPLKRTAGSTPAGCPRFFVGWRGVRLHRETYKLLRGRLPHGLGSTPSASTMRSKLMRMSRRFLIVRQLVRFQPDAPILGTVAEW